MLHYKICCISLKHKCIYNFNNKHFLSCLIGTEKIEWKFISNMEGLIE